MAKKTTTDSEQEWAAIQQRAGLMRVPDDFTAQLVCAECGEDTTNRVLYSTTGTTRVIRPGDIIKNIERLRGKCWCRTHAQRAFRSQS